MTEHAAAPHSRRPWPGPAHMSAPVGISVYGLSGAGKSTTAALLIEVCRDRGMTAQVIKIGAPLYALQAGIYDLVGKVVEPGRQDQQLLRSLATHLRRLDSSFLVNEFLRRAAEARADGVDVVITDDLRDTDTDYPRLVDAGFEFWHLRCSEEIRARRLGVRADLSVDHEAESTWRFDRITPHAVVHNDSSSAAPPTGTESGLGSLDRLRAEIEALISRWWP